MLRVDELRLSRPASASYSQLAQYRVNLARCAELPVVAVEHEAEQLRFQG
jgi:hypothetical protein